MPLYSLEISEFNNLSIFGHNMFKIKPLNIKQNKNNIIVYFEVFNLDDKNQEINFLQAILMGIENKKSLICYDKNEQLKYDIIILGNDNLLEHCSTKGIYYYTCEHMEEVIKLKNNYDFIFIDQNDSKEFWLKSQKYYCDYDFGNSVITIKCLNAPIMNEEIDLT